MKYLNYYSETILHIDNSICKKKVLFSHEKVSLLWFDLIFDISFKVQPKTWSIEKFETEFKY